MIEGPYPKPSDTIVATRKSACGFCGKAIRPGDVIGFADSRWTPSGRIAEHELCQTKHIQQTFLAQDQEDNA